MSLLNDFYRPTNGRKLGGVCAGVARSLNIEVGLVRLVFVLAVVLGGLSAWIYPLLWLVMPDEGATSSAAQDLFGQAREQWDAHNQQPNAPKPPTFNPYQDPKA